MKIKTSEDYIDELAIYFPMIEKEELRRMVKSMTGQLSSYLSRWHRGFSVRSSNTLLQDKKLSKFVVARIFGAVHLFNMRKAFRKRKEKQDAKIK